MTMFPLTELANNTTAQAYVDLTDKDHGYVRFDAAGSAQIYRLPLSAFAQLARDIQLEAQRLDLHGRPEAHD